jgi:hypothetical protein
MSERDIEKMSAPTQEPGKVVFDTTEFEGKTIAAGKIPPEGVVLTLEDLVVSEGKYGEFYIVRGQDEDGPVDVLFSSGKLYKGFQSKWDFLKGQRVNISARGEKYERQYTVTLI